MYASDPEMKSVKVQSMKPLPIGSKHHCFLSYKHSSAKDLAARLYWQLVNRGFSCWYDQECRGTVNRKKMERGVRKSMCYILILSEGVFESEAVLFELETALKQRKPIFMVHDPRTGQKDYPEFDDYKQQAPSDLLPYFDQVQSLPLCIPHYLNSGVMRELEQRLVREIRRN